MGGNMKKIASTFAIACFVVAPALVSAQLPDAPGKETLVKVCSPCHQPERAASVRLTREGWSDVLADMVKRGAKASDEEMTQLLNYLSTHFLGEAPRPLNINRATQIELEMVGGLGRKEAAAVLAFLDKNGPCKALTDLKKVQGLDYKKLEERKEYVVCFEAPVVKK
jgi:competence ComEA-like helix-hairpin-helix protein